MCRIQQYFPDARVITKMLNGKVRCWAATIPRYNPYSQRVEVLDKMSDAQKLAGEITSNLLVLEKALDEVIW